MKLFATVFATVFLAEMADKTQIATLLYASDAQHGRWTVFVAAALALIATTAIAVVAGQALSHWIDARVMGRIAGVAFIAIGVWTFLSA